MALNIAVPPLTTVGDLMDSFGLLSPISPLSVDCCGVTTAGSHGKKELVSPVGSESSGVSSLDSDDTKKTSSSPTTPTEEVERPPTSPPLPPSSTTDSDPVIAAPDATESESSGCSTTRCSLSSTYSSNDCDTAETVPVEDTPEPEPEPVIPKEVKVVIGDRNVLNLMDNLTAPGHFNLQFAQLPENGNIHFFLDNRSQYHRLGATGHIQEYIMVKCKCCDFQYPMNGGTSPASGGGASTPNWTTSVQQQHPTQLQQQQPVQWGSFNNYDSISSRNKLGLTVAVSAFNKTFGGGNNNNNTNNGSQYFRSNNMTTSLFGRDSNRGNSSGNFFNSSTSTYNNHKPYQQSFGTSNNNNSNSSSKFNTPYGNYQFQQQKQQQLFSKNQQMRYGSGNGNGSGGFNASAAVAAATAMAGQNMLNFNGNFNGKNNNNNNNNNMFAYYKAMMNN